MPRLPRRGEVTLAVRFVRNGYANPLFQVDRLRIEIFGFRRAPGIRAGVRVEKQRLVRKAFFHLFAQGIQVLANTSPRCKIMAEDLRHPLERLIFQKTKKLPVIRNMLQRDFQSLIANRANEGRIGPSHVSDQLPTGDE